MSGMVWLFCVDGFLIHVLTMCFMFVLILASTMVLRFVSMYVV